MISFRSAPPVNSDEEQPVALDPVAYPPVVGAAPSCRALADDHWRPDADEELVHGEADPPGHPVH
jgi:hypothetical protein